MSAKVTFLAPPRVERVFGPDRRYTDDEKIVMTVAYGTRRVVYEIVLNERELLCLVQGAIGTLEHLRRKREGEY